MKFIFSNIFSLAFFISILDGLYITVVGMGIYSFSHSILWAAIGGLVIYKMPAGLIAYLAIEYYFNNGNLTVYSAVLTGITAIQLIVAYTIARKFSAFK